LCKLDIAPNPKNIKTKQLIGKLQGWGAIKWDNNSQITVKGPASKITVNVSKTELSSAK